MYIRGRIEKFCLRGDNFINMQDSHMSCTFSESLECPLREVSLFFNVVTIPVHTQTPTSDKLLHPVEEEIRRLPPKPGTHGCLHLLVRSVTVSLEVFLQLREEKTVTRCQI